MNKQSIIIGTVDFFNAWKDDDTNYTCVERIITDGSNSVYVFNGMAQ